MWIYSCICWSYEYITNLSTFCRNKSLAEFGSAKKETNDKLHLIFHFSNSIILSIYMQSTLLVLSLIALMEFMMCKSCSYVNMRLFVCFIFSSGKWNQRHRKFCKWLFNANFITASQILFFLTIAILHVYYSRVNQNAWIWTSKRSCRRSEQNHSFGLMVRSLKVAKI